MLYIVLGLAAFIIVMGFGWRLASDHYTLPFPAWLRWFVELDNPLAKVTRSGEIVRHLDLQPGMKVLDVGCGPGRLTIPVAKQVGPEGHVIAIDIQPAMLRRVQEKAQSADLSNVQFLLAEVGEGVLGVSGADRALLVAVLGEIPNRKPALEQIFNALKPGGVLSVTETIFDPHYQRCVAVTDLARAVGFRERAFFGNRLAYTLHLEKPS